MGKWPTRILMVRPNGFRVDYAINPYMVDEMGRLKKVDQALAMAQWENLRQTFIDLGQTVEVIEGDARFPDMVFSANQTLPYFDRDGRQRVLLARMQSEQRRGEVIHFANWAKSKNLPTESVTDCDFEGAGDAIWNYETGELIGGVGPRSQLAGYQLLEKLSGAGIHILYTVSQDFYHMDTCFAVLNATTAAYVPEAFAPESAAKLRSIFANLIAIDREEAKRHFAGNAVSIDGKNVVLHKGATKFTRQLRESGFVPVEVDVSEFLKAGGAVFCMKQRLF
jgi:N-dimethylarginine dimethylaminohydrolase